MTMTTSPAASNGLGIASRSDASSTASTKRGPSALDAVPGAKTGFVVTVDDIKVRPSL